MRPDLRKATNTRPAQTKTFSGRAKTERMPKPVHIPLESVNASGGRRAASLLASHPERE
jgi:hypothetical protein